MESGQPDRVAGSNSGTPESASAPGGTERPSPAGAEAGAQSLAASGPAERPSTSSIAAMRSVLRVRPFRRLWYSTALSSLGDWLGLLATTALATSLATGYRAQNYALGGVLVVHLLPAIVLGPLAGAFADRFDRRITMVISDVLRFGLFLTIPLAHLFVRDRETLAWLFIASFLIECVSLFWMPAKDASVPEPGPPRPDRSGQPAQPDHDLRAHAGARGGAVLGALADHQRARPAPRVLPDQPDEPRALLQRGDVPGRRVIVLFIPEISGRRTRRPADDQPSLLALLREGASFIRHSRLVGGLIIGLVGAFAAGGAVIGAGKIFASSLGRRQRCLRCAVRRGVRRARRGHGVRPAHRARALPPPAVRAVDRVRGNLRSSSPRSCRRSRSR